MAKKLSKILKDKQYCLLTTFKRNGEGVSSPMWFCVDDEKVYMTTRGESWKVKRIRRNPSVKIGWSNSSGRQHGKLFSAVATIVDDIEEREAAIRQLNKKYGLKKKLIDFGLRFAKDKSEAILRVEYSDE